MSSKNPRVTPIKPCALGGPNGNCKTHGYPFYHCAVIKCDAPLTDALTEIAAREGDK